MSAHVYWRIYCNQAAQQAIVGIAELQLRTVAGGGQAATGGTASASGNYDGGSETPAAAFDGNVSTFWNCSAPGWLQYQFPGAVAIVEYALTARNDQWWYQIPVDWRLQYSDDGSTWVTADMVHDLAWSTQGQQKVYTVGANTGYLNGAAVGNNLKGQQPALQSAVPVGNGARLVGMRSAGPATTVSGTVTEAGTAKGGILVVAYDKVSRQPIGQAITAANGTYSINCGGFSDVYVVAFDPTTYQAIVYDEVTPG